MVPLVEELRLNLNKIETVVCYSQHRQMLDQVLNIFDVVPDYDLNIMQSQQTLEHITTRFF